jgi:hypothetical protein
MMGQRPANLVARGRDAMAESELVTESPDVDDLVDSAEALALCARQHGHARYHVDEHSVDLFPGTRVSAREWAR